MSAVFMTVRGLLADTNVRAMVSDRVQPYELKQGTLLPAIAVRRTSEDEPLLLAGSSRYPVASVIVHCIAETASDAERLGEKVRVALRDLYFSDSPPVGASFVKEALDDSLFEDEQTSYVRVMGYSVRWR